MKETVKYVLPLTTQDLDRQVPAFWFLPLMLMVTAGDAGTSKFHRNCRYNDSTLYRTGKSYWQCRSFHTPGICYIPWHGTPRKQHWRVSEVSASVNRVCHVLCFCKKDDILLDLIFKKNPDNIMFTYYICCIQYLAEIVFQIIECVLYLN